MNQYYFEEVQDFMKRADGGILILASNVTAAKKAASKLKVVKNSSICLYEVTDSKSKMCKRVAVLSDRVWRKVDSAIKYTGVWNETKIKSKA